MSNKQRTHTGWAGGLNELESTTRLSSPPQRAFRSNDGQTVFEDQVLVGYVVAPKSAREALDHYGIDISYQSRTGDGACGHRNLDHHRGGLGQGRRGGQAHWSPGQNRQCLTSAPPRYRWTNETQLCLGDPRAREGQSGRPDGPRRAATQCPPQL